MVIKCLRNDRLIFGNEIEGSLIAARLDFSTLVLRDRLRVLLGFISHQRVGRNRFRRRIPDQFHSLRERSVAGDEVASCR